MRRTKPICRGQYVVFYPKAATENSAEESKVQSPTDAHPDDFGLWALDAPAATPPISFRSARPEKMALRGWFGGWKHAAPSAYTARRRRIPIMPHPAPIIANDAGSGTSGTSV